MKVFFSLEDYETYRRILRRQAERYGISIWLYCLMPNHVHLIVQPPDAQALSQAIGQTHRLYARHVNRRESWCGHLWQERFCSFAMDELHLLRAIRYILLNPVRAGLVASPEDWPFSSARSHLFSLPDNLISPGALSEFIDDWPSFLDLPTASTTVDLFRKHSRSGRPLGSPQFQALVESLI